LFVLVRVIVIDFVCCAPSDPSITIKSTVPQGGTEHEHDSTVDGTPRGADRFDTLNSFPIWRRKNFAEILLLIMRDLRFPVVHPDHAC
jgi:hypothetical protein